uniref:Uncharacterized protein n=1 Tax=Ciona savignyi TaxID=51511 RepID=H2YHC8_CIOSA
MVFIEVFCFFCFYAFASLQLGFYSCEVFWVCYLQLVYFFY